MPFNIGPAELIVIMVIIAVLVAIPVLAVVLFVRWASDRGRSSVPDPRAVLAERLAQGEITVGQFRTAMAALGHSSPGRPRGG
jgi:uncharacterized membrane protein